MGQAKSKIDTTVVSNFMNKMVMNSVVKNTNVTKSFSSTTQTATIKTGENSDVTCTSGSLGITQNVKGSMKMLTSFSSTDTQEVKNDILNKLKTDASSTNEMIQGFLGGMGLNTEAETVTTVRSDIENVVENNFTTENLNESIQNMNIEQDGTIEILGTYKGPCAFIDQNAIVELQLSSFSNMLAKKLVENSTVNEADITVETKQKIEQTGLSMNWIFLLIVGGVAIFLLPLIGGAAGGGKGLGIAFLLGMLLALGAIAGYYAYVGRSPLEESCAERCKDRCDSDDEECVPCFTCDEYCPGNCQDCEEDAEDCYTCAECEQLCRRNCVETCSSDDLGCIECQDCEEMVPQGPSEQMRIFRYNEN